MKKEKKVFILAGVASAVFLGVSALTIFAKGGIKTSIKAARAENIDLVTQLCGGTTEGSIRSFVKDEYPFYFEFQGVTFGADYIAIGADGYLRSVTALNGLSSVTFATTHNDLAVSAGYLTNNGVERHYYFGKDYDATKLSDHYDFSSRSVTHLALQNLDDTNAVVINSMSISYSCEGDKESQSIEALGPGYENYTWDFLGAGTEDTPFLIRNAAEWTKLSVTYSDKNFMGFHFKLTSDLGDSSNPITTSVANFRGRFDGGGHTIYENIVSSDVVNLGLFGQVAGNGTIKNLIADGTVNYTGTENASAGGIAGFANTNNGFENCVNRADVYAYTKKWSDAESGAGGIVGRVLKASISDCTNYGFVSSGGANSQAMSGGIVGTVFEGGTSPSNIVTIERCSNFGNVGVAAKYMHGGIVGLANRIKIFIQDCVNGSESVHPLILGTKYIGGIAGNIYDNIVAGSYVDNCQNYGEVNVSGKTCLGGIAGTCYADITNCTNKYIVTSSVGAPSALTATSGSAWISGDFHGSLTTGSINEYTPS